MSIEAWHGLTLDEHGSRRDPLAKQGYRFLSLSIHGSPSSPRYSAVMIKRASVIAQREWPYLTLNQLQDRIKEQATDGLYPWIIGAIGSDTDARFAVVFQRQATAPSTRLRLKLGSDKEAGTFQQMNSLAKGTNQILRWAAVYGDEDDPRVAGIWVQNSDYLAWNADSVQKSAEEHQQVFTAQASAWNRPTLVTVSGCGLYTALFVNNSIGAWHARHNRNSDQHQSDFNEMTDKGYFPICVQGGGSGSSTRYAAIYVKKEQTNPQVFSANGPRVNNDIDAIFRQVMQRSAISNASLAIVQNQKLVYIRGYTYADDAWPQASPTTHFRIGSVSKLFTSLLIHQLIHKKKLAYSDHLQNILQLKTPAGEPPLDPRFKDITIRQLLEFTAGVSVDAHRREVEIRNAHKEAKPSGSFHLPANEAMCDSYIASLPLAMTPGSPNTYSNCAYYLLGRVAAKILGKATSFDALKSSLLAPLNMTHTRPAAVLISSLPGDEARCRNADLRLEKSVMNDDQPLVPDTYGDWNLPRMVGSGGLSSAAIDLARLLAILLSGNDHPGMPWSVVKGMLDQAVSKNALSMRAGYGFDNAASRPGGRYLADKSGSLPTAGATVRIRDDWGFAISWSGVKNDELAQSLFGAQNYSKFWDLIQSKLDGATDLFDHFVA